MSATPLDGGLLHRMLSKMLKRTERDVAAATKTIETVAKWMPPPKTKRTGLTIFFKDGESLNWHTNGKGDVVGVWNDFLKWYHGRTNSPTYVMQYEDGRSMFRRRDVKRYVISYWEA